MFFKVLAISVALSCPKANVINNSKKPWSKLDQAVLETAQKQCKKIFPNYPCLKRLVKSTDGNYAVTCGKGE